MLHLCHGINVFKNVLDGQHSIITTDKNVLRNRKIIIKKIAEEIRILYDLY